MAVPLYFDPRQQPVKVERPTRQQVCDAMVACYSERALYIRHRARLGPQEGLQAIEDVYGLEAIVAILEFDRMGDKEGPATMSRQLEMFCALRGVQ